MATTHEQNKIFLLSGFKDENEKKSISDIVNKLGGRVVNTPIFVPKCDYVLCKYPSRGEKYLCGSAQGLPLVTTFYINDCKQAGKWLDVEKYEWCNQTLKNECNIDKSLLALPKVAKEIRRKHHQGIFGTWKVLLHVEPDHVCKAYRRLLVAGGAKIINAKLPFLNDLKFKITHAFVTRGLQKDVTMLKKDKFTNILFPEYIPEFLIQATKPNLKRFQHFPSSNNNTPTKKTTKSPRKPILTAAQMKQQRKITDLFGKREAKDGSIEEPQPKKQRTLSDMCSFANDDNNSSGQKTPGTPSREKNPLMKIEPVSPSPYFNDRLLWKQHPQIHRVMNTTPMKSPQRNKPEIIDLCDDNDDYETVKPEKTLNQKIDIISIETPIDLTIPSKSSQSMIGPKNDFIKDEALKKNSLCSTIDLITPEVTASSRLVKTESTQDSVTNNGDVDEDDDDLPTAFHKRAVESKKNLLDNVPRRLTFENETVEPAISVKMEDTVNKKEKTTNTTNSMLLVEQLSTSCTPRSKILLKCPLKEINSEEKLTELNKSFSGVVAEQPSTNQRLSLDYKRHSPIPRRYKLGTSLLGAGSPLKQTETKTKVQSCYKNSHSTKDTLKVPLNRIPDTEFMRKTRSATHNICGDVTTRTSTPFCVKAETNSPPFVVGSYVISENDVIMKDVIIDVFSYALPMFSLQEHLVLLKRSRDEGKQLTRAPLLHGSVNIIESYLSEKDFCFAFASLKENISSFFYPTPELWHAFINLLKEQTRSFWRVDLFCTLQTLMLLHPVKEIPSVYISAFRNPTPDEHQSDMQPNEMYDVIIDDIRLCVEMLKDKMSRTALLKSHMLYANHVISLMETNFNDFRKTISTKTDISLSKKKPPIITPVTQLRNTLIWQMFWDVRHECVVNKNVKDYVIFMLDVVRTTKSAESYKLGQGLLTIFSMLAQCFSSKDELTSSSKYGNNASSFVTYANLQCDEMIFSDKTTEPKMKAWFLLQLQPSWYKYRLLEFLLQRHTSDELIPQQHRDTLKKKLSVDKIIYCYFFMYPQTLVRDRSNGKHEKNESKKLQSNITNDNTAVLNKKNHIGESKLQVACIKNNLARVKELLALGADVNSQDNVGWSPLHEACMKGHEPVVDVLLDNPALDVYCTNMDGISALHDAVRSNQLNIVEKLLQKGGTKLLQLRTRNNLIAADLAESPEMKALLSNDWQRSHCNTKNTTSKSCTSILDSNLRYKGVSRLHTKDVEYYLLLLSSLCKSYFAAEHCQYQTDKLKMQYSLLKKHIENITIDGKSTLSSRLYLKSISGMLNV